MTPFRYEKELIPLWEGDTVYRESVMPVGEDDRLPLLYPATEILSVTSYDGAITYVPERDYHYADGCLVRPTGSALPVLSREAYYPTDSESILVTKDGDTEKKTYWGEGNTMTKHQLLVTYRHKGHWAGEIPCGYRDRYASFLAKLERGEDVTVLFYGDSITYGANASLICNHPPYQPPYTVLVTEALAERYGYTVRYVKADPPKTQTPPSEPSVYGTRGTLTYVNTAVGGWRAEEGLASFDEYITPVIKAYGCDLMVLAFGMNNGATSTEAFLSVLEELMDRTGAIASPAFLLVATMLPNPEAVNGWYGNQAYFEEAMLPLATKKTEAGIPCAVAPVTSVSAVLHRAKRFRDLTGNNINHPNDFMGRVYAHTLLQTLLGASPE